MSIGQKHTSVLPAFFLALLFTSCHTINLLNPITRNDSLQVLTSHDLNKFDGDYEIISVDTSHITLLYALANSTKDYPRQADKNDKMNLKAIDDRHLKASVYHNGSVLKTKIIKGRLSQNYFQFKLKKLAPFLFIINGYSTQVNRIGLLRNGDLLLDTDHGGILLLVIMPTFGSGTQEYNIKFKRKYSSK
jgi:hypothetical protein